MKGEAVYRFDLDGCIREESVVQDAAKRFGEEHGFSTGTGMLGDDYCIVVFAKIGVDDIGRLPRAFEGIRVMVSPVEPQ